MGKRHLTPQEIICQCKMAAREIRMSHRTPWTLTSLLCAYGVMKIEGFKGKRILKLTQRVEYLNNQWEEGNLDLDVLREKINKKAGLNFLPGTYSEKDIIWKKGTYQHWFDKAQIDAQNTINEITVRYMLFFFAALMDEYGFGSVRINRLFDYITGLLPEYQNDYSIAENWKKALFEEAGVVMEMPVDPLTQTVGSIMTG